MVMNEESTLKEKSKKWISHTRTHAHTHTRARTFEFSINQW